MSDSNNKSSSTEKSLPSLMTILIEEALKTDEDIQRETPLDLSIKAQRTKKSTNIEISDDLIKGVGNILKALFK